AIINKCLAEKSSGYDSLQLSQAQILWGLYHKRNVDFDYLMWEDFVYQVEHKDTKKRNEMYYPRFTKVIIHHFMSKDPSILRRKKVNWHYVRDDHMFTTIKLVSRHQNTQLFGSILPIKLTNEDIRNSNAYKEYYAVATGATPPKPKASVWKNRNEGTGTLPGVPDVPTDESEEEISWKSTDEEGDNDEGNDGDEGNDDDDDDELTPYTNLNYLNHFPAMESGSCVLPREDSANSKPGYVLCQVVVAFCLKDVLRFVSRSLRFVSRPSCVLPQDLLLFVSRSLRFVSRPNTRPPMLDRTDFALWQQRIRLRCRGKENGVNILKSIDEGPYRMGTVRETLPNSTEGAPKGSGVQLYDDFEHFRQHKGESIHSYYVRFAKLINDMRNIKMTMSRLQLNSKFVNNMLPEWGRFVKAIKLNRGLKDSNYDQLYAYLKQHETHAQENKMMLERFSQPIVDPLALMSNVLNPQHYSPSSSTSNQATVQDGKVVVQNVQRRQNRGQEVNPRGGNAAGYGGAQNRVGNVNPGQARLGQARPGQARPVKCYNCNGAGHIADDCDAFNSDVDEAFTAQTMFMANLSSADPVTDEARPSYDSDILSEVPNHDYYQDAACAHHEEHVMHDSTKACYLQEVIPFFKTFKDNFKGIQKALTKEVKEMKDVFEELEAEVFCMATNSELNVARFTNMHVANTTAETRCLALEAELVILQKVEDRLIKQDQSLQTVHMLCRPKQHYNELNKDTLEIAEITRKKMNDKMNDPECVTRKVKIAPRDYLKENFLATFTPHKQLTPEQIFWSNDLMKLKSKALKERTKIGNIAIERKILLIANDNLIAECLSQEVFSVATNSELNVARFTKMHVANTTVEARCLALEAELANLRDKSHHHNQKELIYDFSKLEVIALTTKNVSLKSRTLEKVNSVSKDQVKPKFLARGKHAIDVEPIDPRLRNNRDEHLDYLRHLKESVETICDIVEEAKVVRPLDRSIVSACRYTKHSQELLEYAIGVNSCPNASGSQPKHNVKPNKILPAKSIHKLPVEDQPRTKKSHLRTSNRVDSSSRLKCTVINSNSDSICQTCNKCLTSSNHDMCVATHLQSVVAPPSNRCNCNVMRKVKQVWKPKQVRQVWKPIGKVLTTIGHQLRPTGRIFNLGNQCPLTRFTPPKVVSAKQNKKRASCSKHMTEGRSRLMNFVKKFIGTVRFGNDHFGAIMGYGDYVIGDKVVATACYTQNRSLIHTRHHKTPYEPVHNKKPDLRFFRVFGALCYPTNDSENLGKLQPTTDNGIFVGYAPSRKGYRIYNKRTRRIMETIHVQFDDLTEPMAPVHLSTGPAPNFLTPGKISSCLVPNLVPATPYAPPTNKELEILFQPMFDEYMEPPCAERPIPPAHAVQALVSSASTPSSTTIDKDAPSPSISPSTLALQSHSSHQGVAAKPNYMEDYTIAPVDNNPFINVFALEPHSEASSSGDIS
nr:hypothetical protein [Tanacetum cinerariifolium]